MQLLIEEQKFDKILDLIHKNDLIKRSRKEKKLYQRAYLYNFLYKRGMNLTQIGVLFDRNHATVINGLKLYEQFQKMNAESKLKKRYELHVFEIAEELQGDDIFSNPYIKEIFNIIKDKDCKSCYKVLKGIFYDLTKIDFYNINEQLKKYN